MSIQVNNINYSGNNIQTCSLVIDSSVYQIQFEKDQYKVISSGQATSNDEQSSNQNNQPATTTAATTQASTTTASTTTAATTQAATTKASTKKAAATGRKKFNATRINNDLNNLFFLGN